MLVHEEAGHRCHDNNPDDDEPLEEQPICLAMKPKKRGLANYLKHCLMSNHKM